MPFTLTCEYPISPIQQADVDQLAANLFRAFGDVPYDEEHQASIITMRDQPYYVTVEVLDPSPIPIEQLPSLADPQQVGAQIQQLGFLIPPTGGSVQLGFQSEDGERAWQLNVDPA